MNILLSMFFWLLLFAEANDQSVRLDCVPSVSISSGSSALRIITLNKADTIQVRIHCLSLCRPVLESEEFEIQALDSGKFVILSKKTGPAKIKILSDCPPNTSIEMGGKSLDVSGRMPVDVWSVDVSN